MGNFLLAWAGQFSGIKKSNYAPVINHLCISQKVNHIIFMREHNNIVEELRTIGWNGEELFQEARKILTGIYQHIIYSEFLPANVC
jgi:hypothetical protein